MGHWPVLDGRPDNVILDGVLTGSGTNGKGSWVQLKAATGFDIDMLAIQVRSAGVDQNALVDIGVGAAASEVVLVPNLYDAFDGVVTDISRAQGFLLCPVSIPKGTRLAARCQASLNNGVAQVGVLPVGGGFARATPRGTVTAYGTDTANSRGTAVVSGTPFGTFGSWTQLVASTSRTIHAAALMAGIISLTADTEPLIDLGVGAGGSEVSVMEASGLLRPSANGGSSGVTLGFLPCLIPAGTRLSARVSSSNADTYYVSAYGAS